MRQITSILKTACSDEDPNRKNGNVSSSMLTWSINAPRKSRTRSIMMTTINGVMFISMTLFSKPFVAPEFASAWLKTKDPAMINKIIVLIFIVSIKAFQISFKLKSAPSMPVILMKFSKVHRNLRKFDVQ